MHKFIIKSVAGTGIYELNEEKKVLHITIRKLWKSVFAQDVDLQQVNAEFCESLPEKSRLFPLLLSWSAAILGLLLLTFGIYFVWAEGDGALLNKLKISLLVLVAGPIPFFYSSFKYIFKTRPREQLGFFAFYYFKADTTAFEILYQLERRNQAYKLAKLIAEYCRNTPVPAQLQKNIKQRFNNIFAELSESELVFYNSEAVKIGAISYKDLSDEIIHIDRSHKIRNFFCTFLALLLWLPSLALIIYAAVDTRDWIIVSAMFICAILPGVLGVFFWKKRLKNENIYFIQDRFAPPSASVNNDVYLDAAGENEAQTGEFISELQKRLNAARSCM